MTFKVPKFFSYLDHSVIHA